MPMYDYLCQSCGHTFSVRQGYHDVREAQCPQCEGPAAQRISMPAIIFKGSGFYVNDYGGRRTGSPSSDSGDDGDSPAGDSGGDDHHEAPASAPEHSHPHPHPHPH